MSNSQSSSVQASNLAHFTSEIETALDQPNHSINSAAGNLGKSLVHSKIQKVNTTTIPAIHSKHVSTNTPPWINFFHKPSVALNGLGINAVRRYEVLKRFGISTFDEKNAIFTKGVQLKLNDKEQTVPKLSVEKSKLDRMITTQFCIAGLNGEGQKVGLDLRNKLEFNQYALGKTISGFFDKGRENILHKNIERLNTEKKIMLKQFMAELNIQEQGGAAINAQKAARVLLATVPLHFLSPSAFRTWLSNMQTLNDGKPILQISSSDGTTVKVIETLDELMALAKGKISFKNQNTGEYKKLDAQTSYFFMKENAVQNLMEYKDSGFIRKTNGATTNASNKPNAHHASFDNNTPLKSISEAWNHDEKTVYGVRQRNKGLFNLNGLIPRNLRINSVNEKMNQAVIQELQKRNQNDELHSAFSNNPISTSKKLTGTAPIQENKNISNAPSSIAEWVDQQSNMLETTDINAHSNEITFNSIEELNPGNMNQDEERFSALDKIEQFLKANDDLDNKKSKTISLKLILLIKGVSSDWNLVKQKMPKILEFLEKPRGKAAEQDNKIINHANKLSKLAVNPIQNAKIQQLHLQIEALQTTLGLTAEDIKIFQNQRRITSIE